MLALTVAKQAFCEAKRPVSARKKGILERRKGHFCKAIYNILITNKLHKPSEKVR